MLIYTCGRTGGRITATAGDVILQLTLLNELQLESVLLHHDTCSSTRMDIKSSLWFHQTIITMMMYY